MITGKFTRSRKYFSILLVVLGCTANTNAQVDTGLANALQNSINEMLATYSVQGISAAAYIPGKGMWKGVAGESYWGVPIDTTMLFSIGSVTKTFVAAGILRLVDSGQLSLTDTVGALLPPMANVNPAITVKQLLGHTSGMGDFTNSSWQAGMNTDLTAIWYFPTVMPAFCTAATGAPGSAWNYRNANYTLLGMILESKKGDSLHRLLRGDLLQPNNLNNIHMEIFEPYTNPIPHNWSTPTLNPDLATDASATPHQALWSSVEPAGGYFSDPADLATWGYNLYSGKVLSASSLSQMLTFVPVGGGYFNGYGLGSMRFPADGRTYYGHAGNYFGYAASMLYYPVDSICVAILINQDCIAEYEARTLMNVLIHKIAAGVKQQAWSDKIIINPNPANTALSINIPGNTAHVQISVSDVAGKEVFKTSMSTSTTMLNMESLDPGAYFIRIINGERVMTKQVIIQH